jgi:hypothetical protein
MRNSRGHHVGDIDVSTLTLFAKGKIFNLKRRKTMGLFNKKPKTAEDILKLIQELPEEEFDKLSDMLLADEDDNGKPDTMEEIDKAEENIEAKGEDSQTEEDRIDESVAEQEKDEGEEDTQDAKDRVDEAEGEEKALEEKVEESTEEKIVEDNKDDVIDALTARITELEEKLAKVVEKIDGDVSFGNHSPELTEGEKDEGEDSPIIRAYMGRHTR